MNSSGSSSIQGTAKMGLLVKPHLSVSINRTTYRQKADPEGISEDKTLAREWWCNHMADPTIAMEQPQCTARLALTSWTFSPVLLGPTPFRAAVITWSFVGLEV